MIAQKIYEKNNVQVGVNDKFIYNSTIYMFWKNGASLLDETYYSSNRPILLKKKDLKSKKKGYFLYRFFNLEFAPEQWLQKNGYKLIKY